MMKLTLVARNSSYAIYRIVLSIVPIIECHFFVTKCKELVICLGAEDDLD